MAEPHPVVIQASRIRLDLGISQLELGSRIGVTQGAVGNWESGLRTPTLDRFAQLVAALDCELTITPKELS